MFRLILRSLSFPSSCKYVNPHSNLQTLGPPVPKTGRGRSRNKQRTKDRTTWRHLSENLGGWVQEARSLLFPDPCSHCIVTIRILIRILLLYTVKINRRK